MNSLLNITSKKLEIKQQKGHMHLQLSLMIIIASHLLYRLSIWGKYNEYNEFLKT